MKLSLSAITLFFSVTTCIFAASTTPVFNPSVPAAGPFPTDALTVASPDQKTGLRINLPLPSNCGAPALSACTNAALLNQLDGFSINPAITVCFSDAVDPNTLQDGIQIYPLQPFAAGIAINQILYDPAANCMSAKPVQVLNSHTRYLLAVSNSVEDSKGREVGPSQEFRNCLRGGSRYCNTLSQAVEDASGYGLDSGDLAAASVFTTMSATDWTEKARALINSSTTPVALLPAGPTQVFSLSDLSGITWLPQDNTPSPTPQPISLSALASVDRVAFGLYLSPNFLNVSGPAAGSITVTPTGGPIAGPVPVPGLPTPPGYVPVSFHVFLPPARLMPPGGFPVAIYGHGLGDSQFGAPTYIASTLASAGIATLAIEITGHGYGSGSIVQLALKAGGTATVATPGRGIALSPGAAIGPNDGCILPGPLAVRDCGRQAAADLFALVRTIQATQGLGLSLSTSRIYYVAQSFGSIYGTLFHAIEPSVKAAVLSVAGGTEVATSRLSPIGRLLGAFYLGSNNPPLLNVPPAPQQAYFHDSFNDNYVFRDSPPVVNNVPGAPAIQAAFEVADWLDMPGDPLAYASRLNPGPLGGLIPGLLGKGTIIQFALGDLEVPNPANSALIRAASLQSSSWYYRFDTAAGKHPELLGIMQPGVPYPIMPHRFLSNPTIFDADKAAEHSVAMAAQQQVAAFFFAGGLLNPNPNLFLQGVFAGTTLFEIPAALPERLNFLQRQP